MSGRISSGTHAIGDLYGFSFTAPAGTAIAGFDRTAEGDTISMPGAPPPWYWAFTERGVLVGQQELLAIYEACGNCGPFVASVDIPPRYFTGRLSRLVVGLQCQGAGQCDSTGAHFLIRHYTIHLEDLKPPQILAASGPLAGPAPIRGVPNIALKLRDVGGGLAKIRVEADGQLLSEQRVEDPRSTCRPPFVAPVPCPLAATVDLPIDTTKLSDGAHSIAVRVFDATGVNAASYGPVEVTVDNIADPTPPAPQVLRCPASSTLRVTQRLRHHVVAYGSGNWLSGRVRGPAREMRSLRIAVVDRSGVARSDAPQSRVRTHGQYRMRLRSGAPGELRPVVLSSSGEPRACGRLMKLRVRTGLKFAVAPRRLLNGQTITMRGRVLAPPGARGTKITIRARARGAAVWTTVAILRSTQDGRFRFRYRFRRTFSRTTYEFRAVAPRVHGSPYLGGRSGVRRAVVGT